MVLGSGFPLELLSGYTLYDALQDDVTGKLPEDLQQDIAARLGNKENTSLIEL